MYVAVYFKTEHTGRAVRSSCYEVAFAAEVRSLAWSAPLPYDPAALYQKLHSLMFELLVTAQSRKRENIFTTNLR